jgi:cation diffusion facilitator CzcD-associated flavoprotein CzcO
MVICRQSYFIASRPARDYGMLRVMADAYFDVVIVGAGLSGIGAAWHLQDKCPDRNYLILEERESMGGTWDLFRYPGIRSDSDMYTLGYNFKPWKEGKAIADGPSILKYIRETASEAGIDRNIRYQHKMTSAKWSSEDAAWTIEIRNKATDETVTLRCGFLLMCAGYYNYSQGYLPEFKGYDDFEGEIVHPQHWPEDLDYRGKKVVIIGSGATAVTLLPEMAKEAAHVVMLQRSPTYMGSAPDTDWLAKLLQSLLPEKTAYAITRWKNIQYQRWIYWQAKKAPKFVRNNRTTIRGTSDCVSFPTAIFSMPSGTATRRSSRTPLSSSRKMVYASGRENTWRPILSSPRPGSIYACSAMWKSAWTIKRSIFPKRFRTNR